MEELKQRILQDGLVIDNRILKIDNFLNQQIDTNLINHVGQEMFIRDRDLLVYERRRIYGNDQQSLSPRRRIGSHHR